MLQNNMHCANSVIKRLMLQQQNAADLYQLSFDTRSSSIGNVMKMGRVVSVDP